MFSTVELIDKLGLKCPEQKLNDLLYGADHDGRLMKKLREKKLLDSTTKFEIRWGKR